MAILFPPDFNNHPVPDRIVSLVPSQTELLFALGLDEEVAGITKFCIHPDEWFRRKTRIGGTKNLDLDRIRLLQPDLIFANHEENTREDIEALAMDFPVWITNVRNLDDALQMIIDAGRLFSKESKADALEKAIADGFSTLTGTPRSVAYLIWQDPLMTIGSDTFIHDMLRRMSLVNCFGDHTRYPVITADELRAAQPDLLFLSTEPFPFSEKHVSYFSELLPGCIIRLVDGELFSWYGSRLLHSPPYFTRLRKEIDAVRNLEP